MVQKMLGTDFKLIFKIVTYKKCHCIVVQSPEHQRTVVHKFQSDCLAKTAQVSYTASVEKVEEWFKEMSVKDKTVRMAVRIEKACGTWKLQEELLRLHPPPKPMQTRARRETQPEANLPGDPERRLALTGPVSARNNFIFKLNLYASFPREEKLKNRNLDFKAIQNKARSMNLAIKKKIAQRAAEEGSH